MAKGSWIYITIRIEASWMKDAKSNLVIVHSPYFSLPCFEGMLSTFQNTQQLD